MVFSRGTGNFVAVYTYLIFLISNISIANGVKNDITCLKLIKESIQDPFGYFTSWNFDNSSEGIICSFTGIRCWHNDENKVLSIRLADMGFKGQFPRGLEYCTSLTSLDLSHNNLTGPIPFDISDNLKYITFLDLSFNQFSGTIPPEITKCRYLNVLNLNNNHLWGPIPHEVGSIHRLKIFNVSNNGLTGPVPIFLNIIPADSYDNNPGLCGYPLNPCKSDDSFADAFFGGFKISSGISFILILLVMFFGFPSTPAVFSICKKDTDGRTAILEETIMRKSLEISKLEKVVTRMSFTELAEATANFNEENVIGIGKKGIMYRAFLPNDCSLAIKRLYVSQNVDEQFVAEILSLGTQRHANLLPLLGFCIEKKERYLAYKFMENGNLHDWLHQNRGDEARIIEWPLRMKISIGVANGIAWLHHCFRVRIFHFNINSHCILLDHNFEPKISNFWEAKFMNVQKSADSSWNPFSSLESFFQANSDKRDVYCFGLLLLELIPGKELHPADFQENDDNFNSLRDAGLGALVGQEFDATILGFYRVAEDCLNPEAEKRPTMLQVHKRLKAIKLKFDNVMESIMETSITKEQ